MERNIPQMTKLQKEKALFKEKLKETSDPVIKEFLQGKIDAKRKEPKSKIKVKFNISGKEISGKTAREIYKLTIIEFGLGRVKQHFPKLFVKEAKDKVNNLLMPDNSYLKAQISNDTMKKKIDAISNMLKVNVTVAIIKE